MRYTTEGSDRTVLVAAQKNTTVVITIVIARLEITKITTTVVVINTLFVLIITMMITMTIVIIPYRNITIQTCTDYCYCSVSN